MAVQAFKWDRPPSQVFRPGVQAYMMAVREGIIGVLEYYAAVIVAEMRTNASWTDQTANARQTLEAFVWVTEDNIMLVAKQQMFYGLYLELSNGGKYAIVMPTLQKHYGDVWRSVREVVA